MRRPGKSAAAVKAVLLGRLLPVLLALGVAGAAMVVGAGAISAAAGPQRLPDLDQQTPADLVITRAGAGPRAPYVLGFRSAVSNVGDGPFIIGGHRPGPETGTMVA